MRPCLVLCAVVLMAGAAFGQQPVPRVYGGYGYGFGPYVPLVSTPMVSLETVSPNPVGATNATTGLIAGATNSTVSELEGSTSSEFTAPVWYQGGAPLTGPDVNMWPEPIGREGHRMHGPMMEEHGRPEHAREGARGQWEYFSGPEYTTDLTSVAKGPGPGKHVYTNDDVTRQNDKNGTVKYDGKSEKIQ